MDVTSNGIIKNTIVATGEKTYQPSFVIGKYAFRSNRKFRTKTLAETYITARIDRIRRLINALCPQKPDPDEIPETEPET